MDMPTILGFMGGALVGFVGALIPGGVIGAIFLGYDEAKQWEAKYRAAIASKERACLEVTLRRSDGERTIVALHNLAAIDARHYLRVLQAAAQERPFTVRYMADLLTVDEFKAVRDELVDLGYLEHMGDRRAARWTAQGEALLAQVRPSPAPDL